MSKKIKLSDTSKTNLLCFRTIVYKGNVGFPTMAINALYNRLYGPGGSTRRLHQFYNGGEIGSTLIQR